MGSQKVRHSWATKHSTAQSVWIKWDAMLHRNIRQSREPWVEGKCVNSRVPYNTTVECGTSVSSFGQVSWLSVLTSEVHKETQGKQSKGIVPCWVAPQHFSTSLPLLPSSASPKSVLRPHLTRQWVSTQPLTTIHPRPSCSCSVSSLFQTSLCSPVRRGRKRNNKCWRRP